VRHDDCHNCGHSMDGHNRKGQCLRIIYKVGGKSTPCTCGWRTDATPHYLAKRGIVVNEEEDKC